MKRKVQGWPAILVAGLALVAALVGTAIADPTATTSAKKLSKKEKKQVRNIATKQAGKQITEQAPDLSVGHASTAGRANTAGRATNADSADTAGTATNAGAVDGANASDLKTSSGFNENGTVFGLTTTFTDVATATITTHSGGRVLATGSAELVGATSDEEAQCQIVIDGVPSITYDGGADDIGDDNPFVIAVNFARTRPAGPHTAVLECRAVSGTVFKEGAAINVYGLGS